MALKYTDSDLYEKWFDAACHIKMYALCNMPSEICYPSEWNAITSNKNATRIDHDGCDMSIHGQTGSNER